jgi:hypothetical protein
MPSPDKLGGSIPSRNHRSTSVPRRRPSAGESQMAVTAIDHGGRLVTVTSQLAETPPPRTHHRAGHSRRVFTVGP